MRQTVTHHRGFTALTNEWKKMNNQKETGKRREEEKIKMWMIMSCV